MEQQQRELTAFESECLDFFKSSPFGALNEDTLKQLVTGNTSFRQLSIFDKLSFSTSFAADKAAKEAAQQPAVQLQMPVEDDAQQQPAEAQPHADEDELMTECRAFMATIPLLANARLRHPDSAQPLTFNNEQRARLRYAIGRFGRQRILKCENNTPSAKTLKKYREMMAEDDIEYTKQEILEALRRELLNSCLQQPQRVYGVQELSMKTRAIISGMTERDRARVNAVFENSRQFALSFIDRHGRTGDGTLITTRYERNSTLKEEKLADRENAAAARRPGRPANGLRGQAGRNQEARQQAMLRAIGYSNA